MGKFIVEAVATGVLVVVLFVVWALDPRTGIKSGSAAEEETSNAFKHQIIYGSEQQQGSSKPQGAKLLKLAITIYSSDTYGQSYDDMATLLRKMGAGFDHAEEVTESDLASAERLSRYDVLFLTCRASSSKAAFPEIAKALQAFVMRGGVIYSSDLRCEIIRKAFPEFVDKATVGAGLHIASNGFIRSDIVDDGLKQYLGKDKIDLKFKYEGWETASFLKKDGTSFVEGEYIPERHKDRVDKENYARPGSFLFQFKPYNRGGLVIFTSFHNSEQTSGDIQKVLKYLVFKSMTAKAESEFKEEMEKAGISASTGNLISTSSDSKPVVKTITNDSTGKLVFGLNFPSGSGTLKLAVKNPKGETVHAKHNSTFRIVVPDAPPGEWTLTITRVEGEAPAFQIITGKEKK